MSKWHSIDSNPFNWQNVSHTVPAHYIHLEPYNGSHFAGTKVNNTNWYKMSSTEVPDEEEYDEDEGCPFISKCQLESERIIFQPPATIVYWNDGTKTVVKTSEEYADQFEPEVGFAMAFMRKYFGDRGTYLRMMNETAEYHEPKGNKNGRKVE